MSSTFRARPLVPTLAIALALATGILEIPLALLRRDLFLIPIEGNIHIFWMAPLANLVLVLPVTAILWLLHARWPGTATERIAVTVLLALGSFALLCYIPRAPRWGLAVLALGIGIRMSAIVLRQRKWLYHGALRLAVTLPLFLMAFAGLALAAQPLRERWRNRNLRPIDRAPNILLLVLDTVGANRMSLYGYPRETTPAIARWAKSGTVFESARATSPWTLPSHAGMFTARYPHELNAGFKTALDDQWPTLAAALAAQGYRTAGFVANRKYASYEFGLDRGFARYEDFRISPGQIMVSSSLGALLLWQPWFRQVAGYHDLYGRKTAAMVNREFLAWAGRTSERPYFAFINYYDAHEPYLPPAPFGYRFTTDRAPFRPPPLRPGLPPVQIRRLLAAHEGAIAYLDQEIGNLLARLEAAGSLNNTLIVLTSDHGEQFGEHGQMDHGNSLFRAVLDIPLVLRFPRRVPAGLRVAGPVTLRDLPVTILDLAGVPNAAGFPGYSWAGRWATSPDSMGSPQLSGLTWPDGEMALALKVDDMEYIDWFQQVEHLYNLVDDPEERHNLVSRVDSSVTGRYRALLDSLVGQKTRPIEVGRIPARLTGLRRY